MNEVDSVQGDHLSEKLGNVRESSSCQWNIRGKSPEKCGRELFVANFMFGAMPVFIIDTAASLCFSCFKDFLLLSHCEQFL